MMRLQNLLSLRGGAGFLAAVERAAAKEGRTRSEWARRRLLAALAAECVEPFAAGEARNVAAQHQKAEVA